MVASFNQTLLLCIISGLLISIAIHRFGIHLAFKFKFLDYPTPRRRHLFPIPVIGGACILLSTFLSLSLYSILDPAWFQRNWQSACVMGFSVFLLCLLGLIDDHKSLSPFLRLGVQVFTSAIVLAFEPNVHLFCLLWQQTFGPFVWLLATIWIVGISNAMNLIDGLDGLAAGNSLLTISSIMLLSYWSPSDVTFVTVILTLLIPSILIFMRYNWSPARVFLGDNGSIPLGFIIANASLMVRPHNKTWIMIASIILMLGYPILDTTLAVFRRLRKGLPIFKADRNHLHFRILRLGLTPSNTAWILLSIGLYLQVSSLCLNLMGQATATFGIVVVVFSIFTLLFLIRGIERWRVIRLMSAFHRTDITPLGQQASFEVQHVMLIDLEPLLESGIYEEKARSQPIIHAFALMLQAQLRKDDIFFMSNQTISILFSDFHGDQETKNLILARYRSQIEMFLTLFNLQCSLSSLPVRFEQRSVILSKNLLSQTKIPEKPKATAA